MTLDEIQQEYEDYKALYENQEISASEYKDLLNSIAISKAIAEGTDELERKTELNKMINLAIDGLSLVL